eukprot:scaffold37117_cov73-Phaeocystis_antarctica.AAC.3
MLPPHRPAAPCRPMPPRCSSPLHQCWLRPTGALPTCSWSGCPGLQPRPRDPGRRPTPEESCRPRLWRRRSRPRRAACSAPPCGRGSRQRAVASTRTGLQPRSRHPGRLAAARAR